MVDFTSLNTATLETATRFHNFAKNIETAHLGNLYTTVIDGIDYYIVERAAKPLLEKAPEWVYENSVVDSIKNHKGLYILAAGIITLIFINYMLHPKDEVQDHGDNPTSPKSKDDANLENGDGKNKPVDPNLPKPTSSNSKDGKETSIENSDGIGKSTDTNLSKTTPSNSNGVKDANTEKTDEKDKLKDPNSLNVNDEYDPLVEDSDIEKEVKHIASEKKLNDTENKNGDNVDGIEVVGKDVTTNSNLSPNDVHTLHIKEEIDVDESKKEKNDLEGSLKTNTDTKKEDSSSDIKEDTQ